MYLEHANITIENAEKTMEFLHTAFPDWHVRGQGTLGSQEGRWVHFGSDMFYIALQECSEHQADTSTRYINDGINHVGMVVEDLNEISSRLEEKGYKRGYIDQATENHPFRRRAYYFDPNGIEWEFVQYLSTKNEERNHYETNV